MSKVRINDLARELEVKSKSILDALTAVGVTEPKTHSSSIEADEAEKVRELPEWQAQQQQRGDQAAGGGQAGLQPGPHLEAGRRDEGDPGAQAGRRGGAQRAAPSSGNAGAASRGQRAESGGQACHSGERSGRPRPRRPLRRGGLCLSRGSTPRL